ncbi:MAG: flagellar export chaperone FliS [Gemmatimonadaceae bacterium]
MSYGAVAKQASKYREAEVLSASPARLVVIVFEYLMVNLRRAALLSGSTDVANRSQALERARAALTELLVTLNREHGGDMASHLASLYTFMLAELSVLGVKPDPARLDALTALAAELHSAFDHIAQSGAGAQAHAVTAS